jgi:aminoglycoside 3-N-acetyltransferase
MRQQLAPYVSGGDVVFLHSSLSSLGNVEGGAAGLVSVIVELLETEGTLAVPTFMSADLALKETVDLRTAPSQTGIVSETVRTWPGALRSSHPFSSVAAIGHQAEYLTEAHAMSPSIWHEKSPLARVLELDGKIMGLGSNLGNVTFYHVVEDTWPGFPLKLYMEPETVSYIDQAGNTIVRPLLRYNRELTGTRIDRNRGVWIREQFRALLLKRGKLTEFPVGAGVGWVISAKDLYGFVKELAEAGVTIYSTSDDKIARDFFAEALNG